MEHFITDTKRVDDILIGHEWEYGLCRTPDGVTTPDRFDRTYNVNRWTPSQHWTTKNEETGYELNFRGPQRLGNSPERFRELDRWITDMMDRGIYIGVLHDPRTGPNCGNHVHINCNPRKGPAVSGAHLLDVYMEKYQTMFWDLCDIPDDRFKRRVAYNTPTTPSLRWATIADRMGLGKPAREREMEAERKFPRGVSLCRDCYELPEDCPCDTPRLCTPLDSDLRYLRSDYVHGHYQRRVHDRQARETAPVETRLGRLASDPSRYRSTAIGKGGDFSIRWEIRDPTAGTLGTTELRMWNSSMNSATNQARHDLLRGLIFDAIKASRRIVLPGISIDLFPEQATRKRDDKGRFVAATEPAQVAVG